MSKGLNFEDTEVMNYNEKPVEILQLNGNELWNNVTEQVGLDLNYTGLDANGYMEGSVEFDGTIVAYAVGKPTMRYVTQVVPTPTTEEGYYGKYVFNDGMLSIGGITSESFATSGIVVGETPCYEYTDEKTELSVQTSYSYSTCNGYNSEYYGGYDFSVANEGSISADDQIVPDVLQIPNTYNRKPVTKILDSAFDGGTPATTGSSSRYQAMCIKEIVFGSNIEEICGYAFRGLTDYGIIDGIDTITTFSVPDSVKTIGSSAFNYLARNNSVFYKFVVSEKVETMPNSIFNSTYCSKIIYKAQQANINAAIAMGYLDNTQTTYDVVFKKSVKQLVKQPFYNAIAANLVFEHTDDDEIIIDISAPKTAKTTNIYTDSTYVRNYDWAGKNITPTFYSLSEYTGELE